MDGLNAIFDGMSGEAKEEMVADLNIILCEMR